METYLKISDFIQFYLKNIQRFIKNSYVTKKGREFKSFGARDLIFQQLPDENQ